MPDTDETDEKGETTDVASRYWLTNDSLAVLLNLSLVLILFASLFGYTVSIDSLLLTVYALSIGVSNVWAFGASAASKFGDMLGGT